MAATSEAHLMLRISVPDIRLAERRYVLDVLFGEFLAIDFVVVPSQELGSTTEIRSDEVGQDSVLRIPDLLLSVPDAIWLTEGCKPRLPLPCIPTNELRDAEYKEARDDLPVLFGTLEAPSDGYVKKDARCIELGIDLIGGAFYMLTRMEEVIDPVRDAHDRYPCDRSLSWVGGFHSRPIVDEYLEFLWSQIRRLWPQIRRVQRQYRIFMTHDVDEPVSVLGKGLVGVSRNLGGDLVFRHSPKLAVRRLRAWAQYRLREDPRSDPAFSFEYLLATNERFGLESAFFFIVENTAGLIDGRYRMEMHWIGPLLKMIHKRGHEIGLHASYNSVRHRAQLLREKERLIQVLAEQGIERETIGGRYHYLRWRPEGSWPDWESAGISYDSSLGFSGTMGFRCGTCHPYSVFDLRDRQHLSLRERPLAFMETGLIGRDGLLSETTRDELFSMAETVRHFGGELALLWHNDNLMLDKQKSQYEELLAAVT